MLFLFQNKLIIKETIMNLDNINKTTIKEINVIDHKVFKTGKLLVVTIKIKEIRYQFIIVKNQNKLFIRYFDKLWSKYYQELDYIDDSIYYFKIENFKNNKRYHLLERNYINKIAFLKTKKLLINGKEVRKE